ncbi:MAG: hypothetical protein QG654_102 [Patescibacteria group bacterium]|nr:hypothetical protein [Patescibacteria group bacterium]
MTLDEDRDVLKKELEKTTATVGLSSDPKENQEVKKVGVGIRTYSADIADIMRREKGSVIKIALAEQERRNAYKETKDPTSTKNLIVILLGVVFIVSGVLIFIYTIMNRDNPISVTMPIGSPSLIYSENQTQTDITNLTRGNLFNSIHNTSEASFAENETITNMFMTSQTSAGRSLISINILFNKLGIKIPESVTRTLTGQFMLGVYKIEDKGNLFLVFKVKDFNESFSAMKDWEVSMVNDLVRLFKIDPKSFAGDIFLKEFQNGVTFNKESRNLYDDNGSLVFSYIYLDRSTILMTNHSPSVDEIIKRINSQSIK